VFDGKAIIGSANASHNSSDNLVEAAVLTTDKDVVSTARGFVRSLMGEQITPAYLRICKKKFRPPQPNGKTDTAAHPTVWVHRNEPLIRQNSRLKRALNRGTLTAERRLKNQRLFEVDWMTYGANSSLAKEARIGDLFISIWLEEDGRLLVYPPKRIINIEPYKDGTMKKLIFLESPKSPRRIKWKEFRKVLKRGGISKPSENMYRKITNPELKHLLLGLWPSVRDGSITD
jgi:hypothetical protein